MRSMRITFIMVLVLGVVAAAAARVAAGPVAVLVRVEGDVQVERADAGAPVKGAVGMQLAAGDRVVIPDGGRAILLHSSGRMEQATASLTLEAPREHEPSNLFTQTLRTLSQVATTDARTQPNRQGMIRPIAGSPVPIAPRNDIAVLDVRPSFTWFSVPHATGYQVQIRRVAPAESRPERFPAGADTMWTYPASAPPLVPGATYAWTVGPIGAGRPASEQRFKVADASTVAALQATLKVILNGGVDPSGGGLFMAALAYRGAGLFYEADRALDRLQAEGGAAGRPYYMLRGEVYDAMGRETEARQAFEMAETQAGS